MTSERDRINAAALACASTPEMRALDRAIRMMEEVKDRFGEQSAAYTSMGHVVAAWRREELRKRRT